MAGASLRYISYHIISYRIVDLKRQKQNHLKVGTEKPKLKVQMQSVSDDDVRKRLLEKPSFELVAKGAFRLGRCYSPAFGHTVRLAGTDDASEVRRARLRCSCSEGLGQPEPTAAHSYCREHRHF